MKIHRGLAEGSAAILEEVFSGGRVLDRVVGEVFRANKRWGRRDRGFVAESVWEVTRWRRALGFVVDSEDVRALLAAQWRRMALEIPQWWEWRGVGIAGIEEREGSLSTQSRAVRESVPDWLDLLGVSELGSSWDGELAALNSRAPVFLRVNRMLASVDEVTEWLAAEGLSAARVAEAEDALVLDAGVLLPRALAGDSRIEIQDAGSQQIAPLVEAKPGMKVVDACAGAGGKTLHLAALLKGKGEILALDVADRKLAELKRRCATAGVRNVRVERWDSDTLRRWSGWADRVLIDAPCSGLGTLRRQPDLKWRLSGAGLANVRQTQARLLDRCGGLLKPEGKVVYATCSVLDSENRGQVSAFRDRNERWDVEEERSIRVAETGWDGFYAARLVKSAQR